ncbi:MAG: DEAD/DEAH box helicase [Defluviitaleaceae bacterium]|nr:DEAD/DEAH box helicase [Defluviitaleaceae bacterium]
METKKFEDLEISPEILRAIQDMGFEEATPIQTQSISIVKSGKDVLGQSQTGTGKTAAFGIPTLEMVDEDSKNLQALVLCPTRELAIQVSEEFRKLLKYKEGIKALPIYGGQPIERQILALRKGVQIVIGTPGRVIDHMKRRTLKMDDVKMIVLDEADEMLDMGFREDIEEILQKMPEDHQTVLFSATMPKAIIDLTHDYLKDPVTVKVMPKELTVPLIDQVYFEVREHNKTEALSRLLDMYNPELAIVFCNTKKKVDELVEKLQSRGYFAEGLHGDLKQNQRDSVMKKFRNRTLEILVATDVAARGIDVDDIDIVINYDLPQDEEQYIHRIGRTGRAGRSGTAYTFIVGREIYKLRDIMRYTKAKIMRQNLPTIHDIEEVKIKNFAEKIKTTIQDERLTKYINIVENIVREDFDTLDIAAALLMLSLKDDYEVAEDINEAPWGDRYNDRQSGGYNKGYNNNNNRYGNNRYNNRYNGDGHNRDNNYSRRSQDLNSERLFLNIGKKHRVRPQDIVGAIANEANVSGRIIGGIDIYEDFTFVDVPKDYVEEIISKMKNTKFKGTNLNIEVAKSKRNGR